MSDEKPDGLAASGADEAGEVDSDHPAVLDGPHAAPPPPPGGGDMPPPPPGPAPSGGPGNGGGHGGSVSENRTLWLVLSYLGPLAFAPFLMEQKDKEVQWHAKNGILFFAVDVVLCFVFGALMNIPVIGCISCLPIVAVGLAQLGVHIFAIVKALNGDRLRIPGLSDYADRTWG